MSEDLGAGVNIADVTQQTRSKPYAAEEVSVAVSGQAIGVGRRVEGPCLFADGPLGDFFEVICIDDRI